MFLRHAAIGRWLPSRDSRGGIEATSGGESRFHFPYQTRTSVGRATGASDLLSLQVYKFITNFCLLDPQLPSYLVRRLDGGKTEFASGKCTNSNHELILINPHGVYSQHVSR